MTVRCIPETEKPYIAHQFLNENKRITDIALSAGVSRRTIGRVLVEQGIAPHRVKKALKEESKQQQLPFDEPAPVLPELTFFEKSLALFKRLIEKLFKPNTNVQT